MSLLDELGFQQIDPDSQGIVDLDLLDLSVDIEVTSLNSQLGFSMDDIQPVEDNSDAIVPDIQPKRQQVHGIEASDVGSLLEQFEEKASQEVLLDKKPAENPSTVEETNNNGEINNKNVPASSDTKFLTKEFVERIQRLRAEKKKKAVMLPMGVPAKRGRGRAMTRGHPVALPASCTPLRLQRVMMQNQDLRENLPFIEKDEVRSNALVQDFEKIPEKDISLDQQPIFSDHDYFKRDDMTVDPSQGLEEGELVEEDQVPNVDSKSDKNTKYDKRNRRQEENRDIQNDDSGQYFDKLPSYFTALSIPHKQFKKTAAHVTRRGGLSVHDFIERDHSPIREVADTTQYSKIPNYYCSFTNSTKYDSLSIDSCSKTNEDSNSVKDSSGYSSMCHSVQDSDSSQTSSRSRSPSPSPCRSRSGHSVSRQFHARSRKGNYRKRYSCSKDSVSSRSSSCSRSSCSGCGSRSRSRSISMSRSRSRSSSCSSCCSRSSSCSSSTSRSPGRSWQRERQRRAERVNMHRSRDRSRRSSYSRSRSRDYRSRSRSCSPRQTRERLPSREKRRAVKKQEREEEKQKQMRERRIVYVGGIPSNFTRHKLREAFSRFGDIEHVQLHFREHGDNYGFVTFMYTCDAYAAIEKGKTLPELQEYDLCFGGRRQFCDVEYADLDGNKEVEEEFDPKPRKQEIVDFDELLRQAKAKIKK